MIDYDGRIISFERFQILYGFTPNFVSYLGIKNALLKDIRKRGLTIGPPSERPFLPEIVRIFIQCKKGSKSMYDVLNTSNTIPTGKTKWNNTFDLTDIQWKRIFAMPFMSTKDSKLQWLQFRVNHHIVVTNKFLFKIGKTESQLCAFCQTEIESIYLLFDLRQLYTTTRYIAIKSNSLDRFNEIWNDLSFFDNLQ